MTESQIQKKIIKYLEANNGYVVNGIFTKEGVPDLIACYKGRFLGIEVKKPETKNATSPLQNYNLSKIQKLGGYSTVAWSIEQVDELLRIVDAAISTSN